MWGLSIIHWLVVIGVVTVLFGKNKISSVMKDLGGGLREFKRGMEAAVNGDEEPRKLEHQDD